MRIVPVVSNFNATGADEMMRREFLKTTLGATGAALLPDLGLCETSSGAPTNTTIDVKEFHRMRRFANLPISRVAYIERGKGQAALFLHGYPLNGYQWRGALQRLSPYRRCIAADFMGMGYTETPEGQDLSPAAQADMLAALLDSLGIDKADVIANDSGGFIAQVFVARHMDRVRTLLLTNCDVDEDNPPDGFKPLIEAARQGKLADAFLTPQLTNKEVARSQKGMGVAFTHPAALADDTIDCYLQPLASTPLRKAQFNEYTVGVGQNELVALRPTLKQFKAPTRMVWGLADPLFPIQWAEWLDRTLIGSEGIRRIEGANLFFPEEMPDIIAEEALRLWRITPRSRKTPENT
jgi:haloalkane dehalogenase